jgi:hypothetical protein
MTDKNGIFMNGQMVLQEVDGIHSLRADGELHFERVIHFQVLIAVGKGYQDES